MRANILVYIYIHIYTNATHISVKLRVPTLCGFSVISKRNLHIKLEAETSREQLVRAFDYETD